MRITGPDGLDIEAISPTEARISDLAALQRETGWKLDKVNEMSQLEGPALQMVLFLSYRATGRMISFARAGDLLDSVEFVPTEAEIARAEGRAEDEVEPDPTSAATGSEADAGRHVAAVIEMAPRP